MATPTGFLRPMTWRVSFWTAGALGFLWGTLQDIYFNKVAMPKFLANEEKKREKLEQEKLAEKDRQRAELQARLDKYEPPAAVDAAGGKGAKFNFTDMTSDDLLGKWIDFVNEGKEIAPEDGAMTDAFADK